MKRISLGIVCSALLCGVLFGVANVNAYEYQTSQFRAKYWEGGQQKSAYIEPGFKICVKSEVLDNYYVYLWNEPSRDGLAAWPGVEMNEDQGNGVHCFTYEGQSDFYNYVIFSDGSDSKKTIDLSIVNDAANLVHSLVYMFGTSDLTNTGYIGKWVVNDTSALVDMVAVAKGLDADKYTIASYGAVLDALGDDVAVEEVTVDNQDQYDLGADYISKLNLSNDVLGKLTVRSDGENYFSDYLDAYNALGTALNNLVERKLIIVDSDIEDGNVTAAYKPNSDSEINIEVIPDLGYEIESLTVKEIVSYNKETGEMVFGDTTNIEVSSVQSRYEYSFGESNVKGAYITATFKVKTYIITVDGEEYTFDFGTTYEQMLEELDLEKEGYKFLYLMDEDGNRVSDDYVVQGDAEFTAVYEKDEDIVVPDTGGEQGFSQGIKYSLIGCASIGAVMGAVLMIVKQRRDVRKSK